MGRAGVMVAMMVVVVWAGVAQAAEPLKVTVDENNSIVVNGRRPVYLGAGGASFFGPGGL